MVKSFRFIARLSIVALIFFSLQGEVIVRYAEMFRTKTEHQASFTKKNAERQRLIKLQCYTQKFHPLALPPQLSFVFGAPVKLSQQQKLYLFNTSFSEFNAEGPLSLRGPPRLG